MLPMLLSIQCLVLLLAYALFPLDYITSGLLARKRRLPRLTLSCCLLTRSVINFLKSDESNITFLIPHSTISKSSARLACPQEKQTFFSESSFESTICDNDDADDVDGSALAPMKLPRSDMVKAHTNSTILFTIY